MNLKAAYRATGFMFLPTLAFLMIVFCWFFNWTAFVAFVTEQSGWAGFFRIVVLAIEVIVWYYFYSQYCEEESVKATGSTIKQLIEESAQINLKHVRQSFDSYDLQNRLNISRDNYDTGNLYDTPNDKVKILILKPKQQS